MPASIPDSAAEALFGKTRRRVITMLFSRPEESFYLRRITREVNTGVGSVQRELDRLVGAGLVTRTRDGSQVYFQANRDCPVFEDLGNLIAKTTGMAGLLHQALVGVREKILVAFVYGSVARGRHTSLSDIDLMVVGDVRLRDVIPQLGPAQDRLGREINPTVYQPAEFRELIENGNHFLGRVLPGPRIMVLGDEDELERVAGQRVDRQT